MEMAFRVLGAEARRRRSSKAPGCARRRPPSSWAWPICGRIAVGAMADLVVLGRGLRVRSTYVSWPALAEPRRRPAPSRFEGALSMPETSSDSLKRSDMTATDLRPPLRAHCARCRGRLAACEVNLNSEGIVSRETKTFKVTGIPDVQLDTFDGAIEVHSWDRDEVEVEIERRAMEQALVDEMQVTAEQQGDRIVVKVTRPSAPRLRRHSDRRSTSVRRRGCASRCRARASSPPRAATGRSRSKT